jgi:hypothetical protein
MSSAPDTNAECLIDEIRRYLGAIDLFRDEGREPNWRPEHAASPAEESRSPAHPAPTSAH